MEDTSLPKKAKTHKGKVHLNSLLPKLIEDPKQCVYINTKSSSEIMRMVLNDLYLLRRDYSKKLNQKEEISNYQKMTLNIYAIKTTAGFSHIQLIKKKNQ